MKVYKWFYWTTNPEFREKSQHVTGAPKAVLFRFAKLILEAFPIWLYMYLKTRAYGEKKRFYFPILNFFF